MDINGRHCPRAVILGYALGASNDDEAIATFYPRMPGNSTLRPQEKVPLKTEGDSNSGTESLKSRFAFFSHFNKSKHKKCGELEATKISRHREVQVKVLQYG